MSIKIKSINSNQGLPVEQVHKIDRDIYNRLWLATSAGLACYNGAAIQTFDVRTGLECAGLRTVSILFNKEVWIGTDKGIEILDLQGNIIKFQIDFKWTFGIAECILFFRDFFYIGTSYGIIKLSKQGNTYSLEQSWEHGFVHSIVKINDSELLAITSDSGLIKWTGDSWHSFGTKIPKDATVLCIDHSLDHYTLVGTSVGLFVLDEAGDIKEEYVLSKQDQKVNSIRISGPDWWLAFGNKLVKTNLTAKGLKLKEFFQINSIINDILIDSYNNTWVATNNSGLKRISCLRQAIEAKNYGKPGAVYAIKKAAQTDEFIISGDGMSSRLTYKPFGSKDAGNSFFDLPVIVWGNCTDPIDPNKIWLATQEGLYLCELGKPPKKFISEIKSLNIPNRVLLVIEDTIWLGTIAGLFTIKNNVVTEVLNDRGDSFGYIYTLNMAKNKDLWIGTLGQGLWCKTDNGMQHIRTPDISDNGNTYAIALNKEGGVAVLQDEKLVQLDTQGQSKLLLQEYPIAGWALVWVSNSRVAIGSTNGLIIVDVNKQEVVQRINLHLDKSDWQFTFSQSMYYYKDRYLLCGLNAGLYSIDLEQIQKYSKAPEVYLDAIHWQNISPEAKENVYTISTGKWSLNVSVYAPWFIDENQIQYRFKMVGFDTDWTALSPEFRTKYNSLPPGHYELQVQAYTPLSGFGKITNITVLEVNMPWWAVGVTPIVDAASVFYNRFFKSPLKNKNLLERNVDLKLEIESRKGVELELTQNQKALEDVLENYRSTEIELHDTNNSLRQLSSRLQKILEDEKTAIAREVHDVLGQRLTQLKLDAFWLDRKLKDKSPDYTEKTSGMIEVINGTIEQVRSIASKLRPSILDDLGLQAAIEWHASAFEKLTDITCFVEDHKVSDAYNEDIKITVFRIFQESLTNIIRHAKATRVIVRFHEVDDTLILELEDNGIGISNERKQNTTSLGLLGMKERIAILNGEFYIDKLKSGGTLVKIEIPL